MTTQEGRNGVTGHRAPNYAYFDLASSPWKVGDRESRPVQRLMDGGSAHCS